MAEEGFCVVLTTTDSDESAERIANAVLEQRLAACVQTLPIRSKYIWNGKIEAGQELLLLIKAKACDFADLRDAITSVHPYDVPEVISLPVIDGASSYLDWIASSTRPRKVP
jgi:periplasmic divalent cation tolerance protein